MFIYTKSHTPNKKLLIKKYPLRHQITFSHALYARQQVNHIRVMLLQNAGLCLDSENYRFLKHLQLN